MEECENLETLAAKIVEHANQADEHIIEAAMLVRKARERVRAGEAGEHVTWTDWAYEHIDLSESRIRELQRIADAEDPRAELERIRAGNRERQAKYRERSKSRTSRPDAEDRRYVTSVEPEGSGPKRSAARERANLAHLAVSLIADMPTIASFETASEAPSEAGLVVLLAFVDTDGTTHVKSFITDRAVRDSALYAIGKAHEAEVSDSDASSVSESRNNTINEAIEDARSKEPSPELEVAA